MADAIAWCVVNGHGDLLTSTLARTRRGAIRRMADDYRAWRYWKRQGARCIKVTIKAAAEGGNG